jgi:acetaldehyde dehydrogenase (acetylating)
MTAAAIVGSGNIGTDLLAESAEVTSPAGAAP